MTMTMTSTDNCASAVTSLSISLKKHTGKFHCLIYIGHGIRLAGSCQTLRHHPTAYAHIQEKLWCLSDQPY